MEVAEAVGGNPSQSNSETTSSIHLAQASEYAIWPFRHSFGRSRNTIQSPYTLNYFFVDFLFIRSSSFVDSLSRCHLLCYHLHKATSGVVMSSRELRKGRAGGEEGEGGNGEGYTQRLTTILNRRTTPHSHKKPANKTVVSAPFKDWPESLTM